MERAEANKRKGTLRTELDKNFMLTGSMVLSEPFNFGRKEKMVPEETSDPKSEDSTENSTSEISLIHRFANETSAHGCAHVNSSSRTKFWRAMWAVAVLSMLGCVIYTLYIMLSDYGQYPVKTVTKVAIKNSLPFPGVTVCNINDVDITKLNVNGSMFGKLRFILNYNSSLIDMNDTVQSEVLNASSDTIVNSSWINFGEFFETCAINNVILNCTDIFKPVQSLRTKCAKLNTDHHKLQSISNVGSNSGLRMYINVHQAGYVYDNSVSAGIKDISCSQPGQRDRYLWYCSGDLSNIFSEASGKEIGLGCVTPVFPLFIYEPSEVPNLQTTGFLLSPGFSHYVATRPKKYTFLPKPYMAYGEEACVNVKDPSFNNTLHLTNVYTYDLCNLECAVIFAASFCGCKGILGIENQSLPTCTMYQFYKCYDNIVSDVYFNVSSDNKCQCARPCEYTEYQTQITSAYFPSNVATTFLQQLNILPNVNVRENYMEVRVFLDKMVLEEFKHEPVYTYNSVMGTIGGQMGLFLGASLLTVGELLELVIISIYRFLRRISGPKEHAVKGRVIPVRRQKSLLGLS